MLQTDAWFWASERPLTGPCSHWKSGAWLSVRTVRSTVMVQMRSSGSSVSNPGRPKPLVSEPHEGWQQKNRKELILPPGCFLGIGLVHAINSSQAGYQRQRRSPSPVSTVQFALCVFQLLTWNTMWNCESGLDTGTGRGHYRGPTGN
jgi:hypothetical protein